MRLLEEVFSDFGGCHRRSGVVPEAMTTPEVAKDLFKEVQAIFPPIVGAPNDDDVKRLTEAFINVLQSIDVPGGAINLSDLLRSDV